MSDSVESPSSGGNCMATGCLVVAALLYLVTFGGTIDSGSHSPEDGMLVGFAMIAEMGLWVALSIFVLLSCARGKVPRAIVAGAILVLLVAAFAAVSAFQVMGTRPNWISITPIFLPPLAAAFGFWAARSPGAEGFRKGTALLFTVAALLLCLPPAIGQAIWVSEEPAREAARAEDERRLQAEIAATTARYQALNAESPIEDYLAFINQGGLFYEEALTAWQSSPRRQAETIRLLDSAPIREARHLHEFALEPDANLCARYGAAVDRTVTGYERPDLNPDEVVGDFYDQIPNIGWLTARGCDLSVPLNRLFDRIRRFPEATRPSFLIDQIGPLAARRGAATP